MIPSSATIAIRLLLLLAIPLRAHASCIEDLPPAPPRGISGDWLLDDSPFEAAVFRTGNPNEITLENGLVRRTFRLAPNAATVGFDHQVTGHAVLRAVRPEAEVTIDGVTYPVGGLTGQPNHPPAHRWQCGLLRSHARGPMANLSSNRHRT